MQVRERGRERERERVRKSESERVRKRENLKQAPRSAWSCYRAHSHDPGMMT